MLAAVSISFWLMSVPVSSEANLIGGDSVTAKPGSVFKKVDPSELPGVVRVGGGTGFFFKEGWVLTAAHNIQTGKCKVSIMYALRDCWKHPANVDIAVCSVPVSPSVGLAGEPSYSGFEKDKVYVGAGFGCVYNCSATSKKPVASISAGLFVFTGEDASRQEVIIGPMISDGCTSSCAGDSGGPVFAITQNAKEAAAVKNFKKISRERIHGVIVKAGSPGAVVARLSLATEKWLDTLVDGSCVPWN